MKVAVYHDMMLNKGGAERVAIILANRLVADIVTCGFNPELRKWMPIKNKVVDLGNISHKHFRRLNHIVEPPLRFLLKGRKLDYDLMIFTGCHAIYGATRCKKDHNLWFCHTPNRNMYYIRDKMRPTLSTFSRIKHDLYYLMLHKTDQRIVKENIRKVIVNSKNVQERVRKYYGLDSLVIYPPIDTKSYRFKGFGDFFLTVSRLDPLKRVDLIARAFTKMKEKKLMIVGDGPQREEIENIIKGHKNITLLGEITDEKLRELYSTCLATIYMPIDEDFGMMPLEGMASGKACIAADAGGCRETVVEGKTGMLIDANEENLIKAVNKLTKKRAKGMKDACTRWAKDFDTDKCVKQWKREIANITKSKSNGKDTQTNSSMPETKMKNQR
jgi:glycosyltransferase involved in cell wall biosynthesis